MSTESANISDLPLELLSPILTLVCSEIPRGHYPSDVYMTMYFHYQQLTVARLVCKYWLNVLDAIPALWGLLYMGEIEDPIQFERSFQRAVKRQAPLSICLCWSLGCLPMVSMIKILDMILLHVERLRRFDLWVGVSSRAIVKHLIIPGKTVAYALRSVRIAYSPPIVSPPAPNTALHIEDHSLLSASPNLLSLHLDQLPICFSTTSLDKLTYFEYSPWKNALPDATVIHLTSMLQSMPNLVTLKLDWERFGQGDISYGPDKIILPFLRVLEINGSVSGILGVIDAPLTTISLILLADFHCEEIIALFKIEPGRFNSITKLIIHPVGRPQYGSYRKLLCILPNVHSLRIDMDVVSWEWLFGIFFLFPASNEVRAPQKRIQILPSLETLELVHLKRRADLAPFTQALAEVGVPLRTLILEDIGSEFENLADVVGQIKFIRPEWGGSPWCNGHNGEMVRYSGLEELHESAFYEYDSSYTPARTFAGHNTDTAVPEESDKVSGHGD